MASYTELRALFGDDDLRHKIEVAVTVAAKAIFDEDAGTANHANRLLWAVSVVGSPAEAARKMLMILVAANKGAAVGAITGASDVMLQAAVDDHVDLFATG